MEKRGFELRHLIYIIIIIICLIAIGIAFYMQFFKDEKIGLILGITKEEEDKEIQKLQENFLSIFDNSIDIVSNYDGNIQKIKDDEDIILVANNIQEQTENYTLDLKIPYFNINADNAKKHNQQIKSILSLAILSELKEGNNNERIIIKTYNYNLQNNEIINIGDVIKQKNIDISSANKKIKSELDSSQEQNIKLSELGYNVAVRDTSKDEYKIENVSEFFLGENGYLYIIFPYGNEEFTSEFDVIIFK